MQQYFIQLTIFQEDMLNQSKSKHELIAKWNKSYKCSIYK